MKILEKYSKVEEKKQKMQRRVANLGGTLATGINAIRNRSLPCVSVFVFEKTKKLEKAAGNGKDEPNQRENMERRKAEK